jgi:hypothetical protein
MKTAWTTIIALLALIAPVHADEFHLTDATGQTHGPFEFKQDAKLTIAGQEYTISKVLTKEQIILEKMKTIIIPEIEFRQANILEVFEFLQHIIVDSDTKSEHRHPGVGVSFLLDLDSPIATSATTEDPFGTDPFTEAPHGQPQASEMPTITMSVRQISLFDAIDFVCKVSDLQWAIQDGVVMIENMKKEEVGQDESTVASEVAPSVSSDGR